MRSENPSTSRSSAESDAYSGGPASAVAFNLDGPSRALDTRTHAYRRDIADVALAGTLFAPHYAAPMIRSAATGTMMYRAADAASEAVSQLLPGESFAVLDMAGGWAWGYSCHDHYVGYLPESALGDPIPPTHRVSVREAILFTGPSIKSGAVGALPFAALIAGTETGHFIETAAGFLHKRHVAPLGQEAADPVSVAELFGGAPYLWGGRGQGGIDCSGLVQVALAAVGVAIARDTDQQRETVGDALPDDAKLRRGDIIYFPGHVGLMFDETRLIHANAHWMSVVIEPLADVVARLSPSHDRPILSRRRLKS